MQQNQYLDWHFINGKPADFWMAHAVDVDRYINVNKLRPVTQETLRLRSGAPVKAINTGELPIEMANEPWWWKYGGMRVPHLHHEGNIFMLNPEQWKAFSGGIIREFSKKLAESNAVSFGQLMDLSDAMSEIA